MKSPIQLLLLLPALASPLFASATTIIIDNQCVFDIELWERAINVTVIPTGGPAYVKEVAVPSSFTWSHRRGYQATQLEFSINSNGWASYDLTIEPLECADACESFDDCRAYTGMKGFNVGLAIIPRSTDGARCRAIYCLADRCADAFQYPHDDAKTHVCPGGTKFDVVFCPPGSASSVVTPTSSPAPTTTSPTRLVD